MQATTPDGLHHDNAGLTPRACHYLFDCARRESAANPHVRHHFRAAFVEIYNEQVWDLLNPDAGPLQASKLWTPLPPPVVPSSKLVLL